MDKITEFLVDNRDKFWDDKEQKLTVLGGFIIIYLIERLLSNCTSYHNNDD